MSNFEYIIASLPYLTPGYHYAEGKGFQDVLGEIRRDLSARDNATLDFLLKGFDADSLDAPFYEEALHGGNRFLREYFRFDLNLRNAKVRYLNRQPRRRAGCPGNRRRRIRGGFESGRRAARDRPHRP